MEGKLGPSMERWQQIGSLFQEALENAMPGSGKPAKATPIYGVGSDRDSAAKMEKLRAPKSRQREARIRMRPTKVS